MINRASLMSGVLLIVSLALFCVLLGRAAPASDWWLAMSAPADGNLAHLTIQASLLPRLVVGLLAGAALGLAGVLFQQVLRNPLAEPGTLGIFAGAKLALIAAMLGAPALLAWGQEITAFAGGILAVTFVLALGWQRHLAPLVIVIAGLVVSFSIDAISKMLILTNYEALTDLLVWQAGSLVQNSWAPAGRLAGAVALAGLASLGLVRLLTLLDLEEEGARSVGLSLAATRLGAIVLAVFLTSAVAGAVGPIGFIGLAGPAIARALGCRRLSQRLIWAPFISAGLLACSDQLLQVLAGGMEIPTGVVTGLLGAPLLLWLVSRLRFGGQRLEQQAQGRGTGRSISARWLIGCALLLLILAVWVALSLGQGTEGWYWSRGADLDLLTPWRLPRVTAALAAGVMLAVAGVLLQRLTGNALANPELLGVSSGATLVLVVAVFFLPVLDRGAMMGLAGIGSLLVLWLMLWIGRRSAFSPEHMLLIGVGIAALAGSVLSGLLYIGDARIQLLLGWLAGSTYAVTSKDALLACALAGVTLLLVPLVLRWLAIFPLGEGTARSLGVNIGRGRLGILVLTALLTGGATLIVGPLTFIGMMAPHITRLLGIRRPGMEIVASALTGGLIMVVADWLGRTMAFPWQVPAGLAATVIGSSFFLVLLGRRA